MAKINSTERTNTKVVTTNTVERTFGVIKPEGLALGLTQEICRRIKVAGLEIEQMKRTTMTPTQCDVLYGHIRQKIPKIYEPMKAWLTGNPCIILMVEGPNAVAKLLALRGSSNPADSPPGTIRGDYAKDQDYNRLRGEGQPALNIFHASDSEKEAERDLKAFFNISPQSRCGIKSDYFYSEKTGLYVSRNALPIDARVKEAAEQAKIRLDWDDEGRISNATFNEAKLLLASLGSRMMTPVEYWRILFEATEVGDHDMVNQLTSDQYAEWLNRVYLKDGTYIDNPQIVSAFEFGGEKKPRTSPYGGPGWFNPEENINFETGEPVSVELSREKFATSWKYWSPDIGLAASPERTSTAPVRGYVTSVGKPSFDLGIPAESKQPKLMIRECRTRPLSPVIDETVLEEAQRLVRAKNAEKIIEFVEQHGEVLAESDDSSVYQLRERLFDLLGEFSFHHYVKSAGTKLAQAASRKWRKQTFAQFVKSTTNRLQNAVADNQDIVFVMGHKNPDTDAVISTLFEAWRNHLFFGDKAAYVPVVQANRLPSEVNCLLQTLAEHIVFTDNATYQKAKASGLARWISVDQNREPEVQKYFMAMVDHHMVSETAKNRDIPKTLEMLGSSSALVTRKLLGMAIELSPLEAAILYGATLMDTENRAEHKMTTQDVQIMDYLKERAHIRSDDSYYQKLMSELLNTDDAEVLFRRDYKEDWGFGFAVAKIKNGFRTSKGKTRLVSTLCEVARRNTGEKNLPLTLLKITDYQEDNETVNKERIYFAFNVHASAKFRETMKRAVESIIRFEFPTDHVEVKREPEDYMDFSGTGMQLSRKKTAPVLQPIVAAFNRYFYSPSISRWVKRDFLRYTKEVRDVDEQLSTDMSGRINYMTFSEAKRLTKQLGMEMLSISEYWKVLVDAKSINDAQMIQSLQGSNFVEFWDTAILKHAKLIDHPEIINGEVRGREQEVTIPHGCPGLIHPTSINTTTGLPTRVKSPGTYGDPELWRYWEPDSDLVFPCRSYIFLLGQPSWDGKFHLTDSFPNLGIRPTVPTVKEPEVKIEWNSDFLTVTLSEEGEEKVFKWPKNISDYLDIE